MKNELSSALPAISPLKVCMLSSTPPPYGGISHWTSLIMNYAYSRTDVQITLINTAPSWRSVHRNSVLLRATGGGVQLLRDIFRLFRVLRSRQVDVIHLTTSGGLAAVRDVVVSFIAALFRVPLVYHVRFGRVPAIALLRGVRVGRGSIVGAGAVVTKSVPPYSVIGGNPSRVLRFRLNAQGILEHERMLYPPEARFILAELEKWQLDRAMLAPKRMMVNV